MSVMEYPNWFVVSALANFERHLTPLAGKPLRCLQVGVFTGDTSLWLLDNILTGRGSSLTDVDTWQGSAELSHESFDWPDIEALYDERVDGRTKKFKGSSADFFDIYKGRGFDFDFIYVDAAHDTESALADGEGALTVLKPNGLLAFDDYNWTTVREAVDLFADEHPELEPVELNSQAWFRRAA